MTNRSNSFFDENFCEPFVWKEQIKRKGLENMSFEQLAAIRAQNIEENMVEVEKLRQQKLERDRQKEQIQNERVILQRQKELEHSRQWKQQEESFDYNQLLLRSEIRINDGRAKPIDLLIHYVNAENDNLATEIHEPLTYLNELTIHDLEDLLADIHYYTNLERQQKLHGNLQHYDEQYWQDLKTIAEDKLKKLSSNNDQREGINSAVMVNIIETFKNKTTQQLDQLEECISTKIEKEEHIDIAYWESILSELKLYIARSRLNDRYQLFLKKKLQQLTNGSTDLCNPLVVGNEDEIESCEDLEKKCIHVYEQGRYSPILMNINESDLDIQETCIDEIDDQNQLKQQRQSVLKSSSVQSNIEDTYAQISDSSAADDNTTIDMIPMDIQYVWSAKYQPRKPHVFNRVHTGYDWNRYNKTHYNMDNPPPKTIQGYKFNIFYPDLIDKTKTPSYRLIVCEDNKDFLILKFQGGPPYEDIAFKIVNKQWDYSDKHGFRCQFQNNVFQLWFNFSKWNYRR